MMALDAGLRDILQGLESDITMTIQLKHLLPILRQKRLVTEPEFQQLSSEGKECDSEKNEKLIRIIMGKGEDAFDLFVEALQQEQEHLGHRSLAKKLNEQKRNAELKPQPVPRNRKPPPIPPPKPSTKPEVKSQLQDVSAVKYTLSVLGQNELHTYPSMMMMENNDKLMNQFNARLSSVEKDVKAIKDAVNNISLEEKIGRAIEAIDNKLDNLTNVICSQRESQYTNMEVKSYSSMLPSSQPQDETYVYASSNEYIEEQFYETVPDKLPVRKIEHPKPRYEYDYATTGHGPVTSYMPLSNINHDSSDGPYHYTKTIKHQRLQQIELVEEKKLANGKSGEVWLAIHKKEGYKMIIKKPNSEEIFMQEKDALAKISHPNVIRFIDSFISKSPVLIFEYAENGNLLNYLKSSASSLSTSKLLTISADVACGMMQLESCAIVHCDVRAKSILIDSHFVCKVTSFSKARCLKPGESSYTPPGNVTVNLPIRWAAPEILRKRKFSIKSDVWAFAVLLSEVFSQGNIPYPNMDNAEVKNAVQKGTKMAQPSRCPTEVYELMKCCFELHAKNRPTFAAITQKLMDLHCKSSSEGSGSGSECEDL